MGYVIKPWEMSVSQKELSVFKSAKIFKIYEV